MGCVQSQPADRRKRNNNDRRRRDRKDDRRRRRHSSDESETESDSDSEEERRRKKRRKRREKERAEKDDDDQVKPSPAPAPQPQADVASSYNVLDKALYAKQYPTVSEDDFDLLWYKARTCFRFDSRPVSQESLRNALKLALLAPSAYNCCPMRVVFCTTQQAKARLISCIDPESQYIAESAPVTAIVCSDLNYTHHLPKLMPYVPNAQQMFEQYDDLNEMIRIRNTNLQVGYLIVALRALGLSSGCCSSFNNEKVEEFFLQSDPAKASWKSILLISIGYPHQDYQAPERAYRLPFEVAAKLL